MNKIKVERLVKISAVAAIYFLLTVLISPLSYGEIQFRFSEVLILLVFYKKDYAISMILGCFLANFFSPFWYIDIFVGTFATCLSVLCIRYSKNLFIATLFPTIFCFLVGIELSIIYEIPLIITTLQVMAGEFVVVTIIGYPLFKLLQKNEGFKKYICE